MLAPKAYDSAISSLAGAGYATVAATCLGCGYGRVTPAEFVRISTELFTLQFDGVERVTLMTTNTDLAEAIDNAAVKG